jgi:hypothetical protein
MAVQKVKDAEPFGLGPATASTYFKPLQQQQHNSAMGSGSPQQHQQSQPFANNPFMNQPQNPFPQHQQNYQQPQQQAIFPPEPFGSAIEISDSDVPF